MTYSIADLDEAVENEEAEWEGSWHGFRDAVENTTKTINVPEGTAGAYYSKYYNSWRKVVPVDEPGAVLPDIGRAVYVDGHGGEGQGDEYWFVFSVTDEAGDVRLFRRNGWYASYSGSELDGPTDEVVEAQQMITVYNTVS